jgi:2-dehydro-3-deoxy-D-gluconate 5-dehydrogenase
MANANPFELTGRVALVTGGNGGLGRSIALAFARAGADVAILGRNPQKNAAVLKELEAIGVRSTAIQTDITDSAQIEPAVASAEKALGPIGILVNNAGIGVVGRSLELSLEDWNRVVAINLTACFLMAKAAAASMVKRKSGKIINISSMYGLFGNAMAPSYSATKGALIQLTRSQAIEFAPHNIQVNVIAPGYFETDLTAPLKELPFLQQVIARTPAGRWGQPDECGGAAVFLAAQASDFVTGATLVVDGGYSIY